MFDLSTENYTKKGILQENKSIYKHEKTLPNRCVLGYNCISQNCNIGHIARFFRKNRVFTRLKTCSFVQLVQAIFEIKELIFKIWENGKRKIFVLIWLFRALNP